MFAATFSSTADNAIKATSASGSTGGTLSDEVLSGSGQVTVDGLIFNSSASGVLRYRAAGNASCALCWNTNGSFFTSNTAVLPAVGSAVNANDNVRTWLAVPVTSGTAFTVTVSYKPTNTTAGVLALLGSDNKVLVTKNTGTTQTADTVTFSGTAGHSYSHIKVFYSRDGVTSGGVNITQIVRTQ